MISESEEKLAIITYKLIQASKRRNALVREKAKGKSSCATTTTTTITPAPSASVNSTISNLELHTMDNPGSYSAASVMDSSVSTLASSIVVSSHEDENDPRPTSPSSSPATANTSSEPLDGDGVEEKEPEYIQQAFEYYKMLKHAAVDEIMASRLVVTNIAADATADDLHLAFRSLEPFILDITMLNEREPIKRTQTAYIDFASRDVAVKAVSASKFWAIFGLRLHADLAVKDENTSSGLN